MSDPSTPHTKLGDGEATNGAQKDASQPNQLVRHQSWKVVEEFTAAKEVVAEAKAKKDAGKDPNPNQADRLQALKREVEMTEHIVPIESIYAKLNTSPTTGLTKAQAARLLEESGPNELTPPPEEPEWKKLVRHLGSGFSLLLWGGGIFAFVAYWIDSFRTDTPDTANVWLGVALLGVVIITGLFSYYQERSSSAIMAGFKKLVPQQALVIRDGEPTTIEARDIVLGDIVEIRAGDKIAADLRMIKVNGLKVDNSSLTGEAEPQSRSVEKTDDNPLETRNLAFYSTLVTNGSATGVVISRGDDTIIGRIANLVSSTENVETPIAREIQAFVHVITIIAVILGVIFFICGLFVYRGDILTNIISVIGIIVANVPEGLLATVTVALTLTAKKMATKNVLVKQLEAVETLGSTTTICSDKTGTLTQNRMTVSHLFYDGAIKTASPVVSEGKYDKDQKSFVRLLRVATVCNRATFDPSDHTTSILDRRTTGDASESALIKFAEPLNPIIATREKNPNIADVPFNSSNKFAVNIVEEEGTGKLVLTMKGAPERIIDRCSTIMMNGEVIDLTDEHRQQFQDAYDTLGGQGERVLGFCEFYLPEDKFTKDFEFDTDAPYNFPLEGLCFLGLISLIDPPRDTVPDAVRKCQSAGIKVIMVTGDHPLTAKAIAKQVGIVRDEDQADFEKRVGRPATDEEKAKIKAVVVNGAQLREMTEDDLDAVMLHQQIVFARTSPTQKLRIVEACQRRKEIVAVTGDGVNDSPALKKADIGVAMGISGSDVSKEAANMILLDDNFASIVNGVEEGRLIFDNLKKSIAYTLSSNIPEISPFIFFILLQLPIPLTTVLILGIDLGTDLLPAISLAYEKAESDIMNRPPRNAEVDALVTGKLIAYSYLQIGMMQAVAGFYTYFVVMADFGYRPGDLIGAAPYFIAGQEIEGDKVEDIGYGDRDLSFDQRSSVLRMAQSAFFVSIIIVQWADLLITKTRKLSLFQQGMRNPILTAGLFEETLLGVVLVYVPFFNSVFRTLPIQFVHWLPALPWSVLIFVYDEIRKYLIRENPTGWVATVTYY